VAEGETGGRTRVAPHSSDDADPRRLVSHPTRGQQCAPALGGQGLCCGGQQEVAEGRPRRDVTLTTRPARSATQVGRSKLHPSLVRRRRPIEPSSAQKRAPVAPDGPSTPRQVGRHLHASGEREECE
jgi:hypothetical protein